MLVEQSGSRLLFGRLSLRIFTGTQVILRYVMLILSPSKANAGIASQLSYKDFFPNLS
jgi:hypothetical protein